MAIGARLERGNHKAALDAHYRQAVQVQERAALIATDRASRIALTALRQDIQAARLGRLGNGLGATSDLKQGRGVYRRGTDGFSASGIVFIRSGSDRTRGTLEAYTEGAEIRPVRGRWLWIATDEIPRVAGRYRMTPELYRKNGFETKIGPLVRITAPNGNPLLVVKSVGVNAAGKPRSARSLTRSGRPRKGQRLKEFVVAFIGIPRTSRAARVDVQTTMRGVQQRLPALYYEALGASQTRR